MEDFLNNLARADAKIAEDKAAAAYAAGTEAIGDPEAVEDFITNLLRTPTGKGYYEEDQTFYPDGYDASDSTDSVCSSSEASEVLSDGEDLTSAFTCNVASYKSWITEEDKEQQRISALKGVRVELG